MKATRFGLPLLLLLLPPVSQCWWETGHQVTARIAAYHLTGTALARVAALLEVENNREAVADALAAASTWADDVKADTQTASWHFLDLTLQDGRDNMLERCPNDDCVLARIKQFAAQLKADDTADDSRWTDLDALRFVVHFIGDIHQPLHDTSNADRGGNCETLAGSVDNAKNLHALWDGPLVTSLGADDRAIAADLESQIRALEDGAQDLSTGSVEDWIWEAHRLAVVNIYRRLEIPKESVEFPASCQEAPEAITEHAIVVDDAYLEDMRKIVRQQLSRGGLRLAKVLNDALD